MWSVTAEIPENTLQLRHQIDLQVLYMLAAPSLQYTLPTKMKQCGISGLSMPLGPLNRSLPVKQGGGQGAPAPVLPQDRLFCLAFSGLTRACYTV